MLTFSRWKKCYHHKQLNIFYHDKQPLCTTQKSYGLLLHPVKTTSNYKYYLTYTAGWWLNNFLIDQWLNPYCIYFLNLENEKIKQVSYSYFKFCLYIYMPLSMGKLNRHYTINYTLKRHHFQASAMKAVVYFTLVISVIIITNLAAWW